MDEDIDRYFWVVRLKFVNVGHTRKEPNTRIGHTPVLNCYHYIM
jgi:hypothetical protein